MIPNVGLIAMCIILDIEGLSVLPYGQKECDYNKYHFESMLVTKTQAIELAPPKCVQ